MLMITSFANPRVAQAFVDYMATQGVILTIQQHNQSDVWLADESQAERVRAELARFLENLGGDDRLRGGVYRHANSRRSGSDVMAGLAIRSNTEI